MVNWVDLSIILILFGFAVSGFKKPLFFEVLDLVGFLLSFLFSLKFYNFISGKLEGIAALPHSFANVLGFIFVWYIAELIIFILVRVIYKNYQDNINLPGEKFISIFPSVLRGIVVVAVILILIATFPIQPRIKKDIHGSKIGSTILTHAYQLEIPLKNIFGGLANDSLSFLTIKPKTNESVNLGFKNDKFTFNKDLEAAMVALVNKERAAAGVPQLTLDSKLTEVARKHSADMFQRGYFSHYSPEGEDVAGRSENFRIEYMVIGENLAFAPSLELAHKGLMNSPGHKANILSPDYRSIGIGAAQSEDYGIMFTQVFKD